MTKAAHHDASSPLTGPLLGQIRPEAILDSYGKWIGRVEDIYRTMIGNLQQTQDSGWELAKQLSVCTDPAEATRLCSEWTNARRDSILDDGRRLSELTLKLWDIDFNLASGEQPATAARANLAAVQRSMAAGE